MNLDEKKVVVGMSGGVDSSVAAYLLKRDGYDVVGVMLKLWAEEGGTRDNACCSLASVNDARRVAASIGIPFYLLDAAPSFYEKVVVPFIEAYLRGETPNPCADCNPLVRWRWLLNYANLIGAKYVATGHYARIRRDGSGIPVLSRGADRRKDQSYVLSRIPIDALKRSLFPLGDLTKLEVRQIAKAAGLPSSEKKESQDICFIADGDYRAFLRRRAGGRIRPGAFVDPAGKVLGEHDGLPFYTIGQRKGIRIPGPEPKYVLRKNAQDQTITVGDREDALVERIRLRNVNWLRSGTDPADGKIFAQPRYKSVPVGARFERQPDGSVLVQFSEPQPAIAPGQICALYDDSDQVIASGTINLINLSI